MIGLLLVASLAPHVVQISASEHVLALMSDGKVKGWGTCNSGELGEVDSADVRGRSVKHPITIDLPKKAVFVKAGPQISFAIIDDGTLFTWGDGANGRFGTGQASGKVTHPSIVPIGGGVAQVAVAGPTVIALDKKGEVWAWGGNNNGGLGNGATMTYQASRPGSLLPVKVSKLPAIREISGGTGHFLALTQDGHVYAWGSNYSLETGTEPRSELGKSTPTEVKGLDNVIAIAAGSQVSSAVKKDGTVWVWGTNQNAQWGNGKRDDIYGEAGRRLHPGPVPGISGARSIVSGDGGRHTIVLLKDGTIRTWGNTDWGQCGTGIKGTFQELPRKPAISGVAAIFAGGNHSFAVNKSGQLFIWGADTGGEGILAKDLARPTPFTP